MRGLSDEEIRERYEMYQRMIDQITNIFLRRLRATIPNLSFYDLREEIELGTTEVMKYIWMKETINKRYFFLKLYNTAKRVVQKYIERASREKLFGDMQDVDIYLDE